MNFSFESEFIIECFDSSYKGNWDRKFIIFCDFGDFPCMTIVKIILAYIWDILTVKNSSAIYIISINYVIASFIFGSIEFIPLIAVRITVTCRSLPMVFNPCPWFRGRGYAKGSFSLVSGLIQYRRFPSFTILQNSPACV